MPSTPYPSPAQRARLTEAQDATRAALEGLEAVTSAVMIAIVALDELATGESPLRPRGVPPREEDQ